jgi:molybdenum cofactor cytidylyltransferase
VTAIRGVLLAGGTATRFGSQKLLHRLPDGKTIGERSALNLLEGVGSVLVVLRPGNEELKRIFVRAGCEVLETGRALEGMGGSLAAAISALPPSQGYVVALADMPFIEPGSIRAVRNALGEGASIAIPVVAEVRGHPVGFSAAWADDLKRLEGDEGARRIVAGNADRVTEIPVSDPNISRDIDTPQDLA